MRGEKPMIVGYEKLQVILQQSAFAVRNWTKFWPGQADRLKFSRHFFRK
jgi:hypothetical protein